MSMAYSSMYCPFSYSRIGHFSSGRKFLLREAPKQAILRKVPQDFQLDVGGVEI